MLAARAPTMGMRQYAGAIVRRLTRPGRRGLDGNNTYGGVPLSYLATVATWKRCWPLNGSWQMRPYLTSQDDSNMAQQRRERHLVVLFV